MNKATFNAMRRSSQDFSVRLKKWRLLRHASARAFVLTSRLPISYPQYSRFESGKQLPTLPMALEIAQRLGVPALQMSLAWLGQWTLSREGRGFTSLLVELRAIEPVIKAQLGWRGAELASDPDRESYVFAQEQGQLRQKMSRDPRYRDLFVYINGFFPDWVAFEELARALKLPVGEVEGLLEDLAEEGIVRISGAKVRVKMRTFFFPDSEPYFEARNLNVRHNVEKLLEDISYQALEDRRGFRTVVSRVLTEQQLELIIGRLEHLVQEIAEFPEVRDPKQIYSLCLLLGERFSRV